MLRRLVPLLLTLFVAATAVAAVEVSVSDFALQTAPGSKRLPVIAAGDGGYLAAWLDQRSGGYMLMATRIAPTGEPLEPFGIPLGHASFFRPQILWNGDDYLVFWNDTDERLLVTRMSRDGIAAAPRVLRQYAWLDQRARSVAANGSHIVLAYNSGGKLWVAVLTPDGVPIEDRIVDIRNGGSPTVVANGDQFLVAWNVDGTGGQGDFVAVRLDHRGAPIDASPRKIGVGWDAEILRNGSNYVAISQPVRGDHVSWPVRRDLAKIGEAAPLPLDDYDREPSLLDGSPAMLAVYEASEKVFITAVTFDANGREAGPRKRIVESLPDHFAVTRGGGALAMIEVESNDDLGEDALISSMFDENTLSRTAADHALALSGNEENHPVIAGGAGRFLAVWEGLRGLTAGRFLPDGTRLDADGFVLDSPASSPAVVFDGERFIVSYTRNRNNHNETMVRFVSPADGLLPDVLMLERSVYEPAPPNLAVGGGVVLATWMRSDGVHVLALRGTQVVIPERKIADSRGREPVAKWNGRHFLVVWNESDFDYDMEYSARLRSMRIRNDLTLSDAQPRLLLDLPTEEPVLAAWKEGWLLAFQRGPEIRLHEIDKRGAMKESPLVTMAGSHPRLVNAAAHPWLAWTTHETRLLQASQIRPDGTLNPDGRLSIAAPLFGSSFGYDTALGSLGNDIAAAYARVTQEAGFVGRAFISVMNNPKPKRRAVR